MQVSDWSKLRGYGKAHYLKQELIQIEIRTFHNKHGLQRTLNHYHIKQSTFKNYFPDLMPGYARKWSDVEVDILMQSFNILRQEVDMLHTRVGELEGEINDIRYSIADKLAEQFKALVITPLFRRLFGMGSNKIGEDTD